METGTRPKQRRSAPTGDAIVRRRGRPRADEAARRIDHVLETAARLFMQEGFAATIDRIATAAGVSKPTIYARFPDKLHLFRAVLGWLKARAHADEFHFAPEWPLPEALRRYGMMLHDLYVHTQLGDFTRLMQKEYERFPELDRISRREFRERHVEPLRAYLDARPPGELRVADSGLVALTVSELVAAEMTRRIAEGEPPSRRRFERHLDAVIDILLHGIAGDRPIDGGAGIK